MAVQEPQLSQKPKTLRVRVVDKSRTDEPVVNIRMPIGIVKFGMKMANPTLGPLCLPLASPSALDPRAAPVQHRRVLAQGTTLIPYSSMAVTRILTDPRRHWTVSLDGDGQAQLAKVGVKLANVPIYKHVRLEVGDSHVAAHRESVMLAVSWTAAGGPPLFPKMEGTLHADPYGSQSTRLTLNARYDPPMGALGNMIDRALMHRLAQSTMDDFVFRLAASLTDELRRETEER